MPGLNFQLGRMEPEQTETVQKPENRQTPTYSAAQRPGGVPNLQPPARTSHAAHGPLSQMSSRCRQGARRCYACCSRGYEREPLQPHGAGREDTTAVTRMREAEGCIWVPRSEAAQSRRKPLSHPVTAEKAWRTSLVACAVFKQIQSSAHISLARRWS